MPYTPVEYQEEALKALHTYLDMGGEGPVVDMFTGGGKTVVFSQFIHKRARLGTGTPLRVCVLVNNVSLVLQNYRSMVSQYPELEGHYYGNSPALGRLWGDEKTLDAVVTFASMQTLATADSEDSTWYPTLEALIAEGAMDIVIIDEMHHIAAESYEDVILPAFQAANPDVVFVGFTATLYRDDKKSMARYVKKKVASFDMKYGIENGWLKRITAMSVRAEVNGTPVQLPEGAVSKNGKINETKVRNALKVLNWREVVYDAWWGNTQGKRSTMMYFADVGTSYEMAKFLNEKGIRAAHVDHKIAYGPEGTHAEMGMSYWAYREYLELEHAAGRTLVMCNKDVYTEGHDAPIVSCIVITRPTNNPGLMAQIIGRGLRRPENVARILRDGTDTILVGYDGKLRRYKEGTCPVYTDCLVLDFTFTGTPVLLVGSLGEAKYETPDIKSLEKIKTATIFNVEPVDPTIQQMFETADGWRQFDRNFFRMDKAQWTGSQHGLSVYLGKGRALFLADQQLQLASKIRRILAIMTDLERAGYSKKELDVYRAGYKSLLAQFESYILFHIVAPEPVIRDGKYEGPVSWKLAKVKMRRGDSYATLNDAMEVALDISQRAGSAGMAWVDRKANWRKNRITTSQARYLEVRRDKETGFWHSVSGTSGSERIAEANNLLRNYPFYAIQPPTIAEMQKLRTAGKASEQIMHHTLTALVVRDKIGPSIIAVYQAEGYWEQQWETFLRAKR